MARTRSYALCIENEGHRAALDVRKVYEVLPDPVAQKRGLRRVIDESGEDYLYPVTFFVPIALPRGAVRAFSKRSA